MDYIPDELALEATLEDAPRSPLYVDSHSPTPTISIPSRGTSSYRGTKQEASMIDVVETQYENFITKLDVFVSTIGIGK